MADEDVDSLKLYWDHFFKAETGTYEKSTWLDLFLAEFLIRINDGADAKELINFCPVSGVVTLVGCELLCGIHRVTSSISSQRAAPLPLSASPNKPTDGHAEGDGKTQEARPQSASLFARAHAQSSEEILRKYLLAGVPWRCLALLRALGVEGLSCCRQLSSVLIWLFGELSTAPAPAVPPSCSPAAARVVSPAPSTTPIHQLFSERIWASQKPSPSSKTNAAASENNSISGRSRRGSRAGSPQAQRRRCSEPSSESGESTDDLQLLNRSLGIQMCRNDDFQYFRSGEAGESSCGRRSPRRRKPRAEDHLADRHREMLDSEIGAADFSLMAVELLGALCRAESGLAGAEGSQVCVQAVDFALRHLCSLQFGGGGGARLKLALAELLMVALDRALPHAGLRARLVRAGVLPVLLRLLDDLLAKSEPARSPPAPADHLRLAFGLAYSVTAFFHCLLMRCRSVEELHEFTDQFRQYGSCARGGPLRACVELLARGPREPAHDPESTLLARRLVGRLGRLVAGMKRVRADLVHAAACARSRHRACRRRVAAGLHHHHEALGAALGGPPPPAGACCVGVLYGALAALLADEGVAARGALRSKVLRVMLACGACCCFAAGALVEAAVRLALTHAAAAPLCLRLLERTVYGELGAGVVAARALDRLPCAVCERRAPRPAPACAFLVHYGSLLQLDNRADVLRATVAHVVRVTPRCRAETQHELLFGVVYPAFIVAKHRYAIRAEETAYFLTASCLNLFASLLGTPTFAETFVQRGGLSYVLELVALPEFAERCCVILELTVAVELAQGAGGAVRALLRAVEDASARCVRVYEVKLPADTFARLADVSAERAALGLPAAARAAAPSAAPGSEESCVEDHVEAVKLAATFWRTCAALCAGQAQFRAAAGDALLALSCAPLKVSLHVVCRAPPPAAELRLLVRLVEALLTVHLALTDVTSGRSKETSCALVRSALAGPAGAPGGGAGLRALCEALVRVATAQPRARRPPRTHHAKVPPLVCGSGGSSGECSSSEESALAAYTSDRSDPPGGPDEGYEADVEISRLELVPPYKIRKVSSTMSTLTDTIPDLQASLPEALSAESAEPYKHGELAHPELCIIVVDILTQLIDKVLTCSEKEVCRLQCMRVGAALARACCARLAGALGGARAPPRLLPRLLAAPTARLLATPDTRLQELQRSILELFHVVASQSLEAAELAAFLKLFATEAPPLTPLLGALHRLVSAATPHTPDCILTFPIDMDADESMNSLSDEFVHLTMNGVSSQSHLAETTANKLHESHLRAGVVSGWSAGAVRCGVEGAGWAPWLAGFALVLWIRTERCDQPSGDTSETESEGTESKPNKLANKSGARTDLSHVISVGHDSLLLEMWLDTHLGVFVFRLTRPESNCNRIVSEASVVHNMPAKQWACIALNVTERVHKRHMYIQVTVFVNGYEVETVSLPMQGILVRKVTPTCVLVGHARPPAAPPLAAYHLAAASVYRTPILTTYYALHIAAHGPDSACMVRCEAPNYSSLLTNNLLDSNIDWDQVYEMSHTAVRELHDNLLLTFSASAPHIMNLYHQTAALPTGQFTAVFAGRVSSPAGLMSPGGAHSSAGASIPETLWTRWRGAPLASRHRGLAPALYMLQGAEVLLYLYARVVELEGSATEQATALGVVLRACRSDDRLYAAFHADAAPDMLLTVFSAPKCLLTPHLLKVILDEACSCPLLRVCGAGVVVCTHSDAVLREPALLVLLARANPSLDSTKEWSWEEESGGGGRGSLWALTLCCLRVLLRPDHPRRAFNHTQMSRHSLLHHLLLACKERFLNSESGAMEPCASSSLVSLVRGLTGEPPLPHRLALLADFLLLMHQASDTFVTHSRANFYFLLSSETQEMSELNSSTRRKSSKRSKRKEVDQPSLSSASTDDVTTDNSLNGLKDSNRPREDSDKMESSADSTKHLKGIINMQIKEGRKHQVSSTSENSDTGEHADGSSGEKPAQAQPGSEGGAGGVGGDLTEYIVVDERDVSHTTVEMYSSGIYHQGQVRAGAADWAACEGLLLLLRDTVAVLPEHALHQAVMGCVQVEGVAVLGNHRAGGVRAAAVRLLAALQRRATPDLARKLAAHHYYIHLANQISLYEGTWELAAACAALITKCDVPLEDQLDDDIWVDVTEESIQRSPPLLALLPTCLSDVPLAHNITRLIKRLIDKASLKLLSEVSVAEVVVRSLRAVGLLEEEFEGRALLLEDLQDLLNRLAVKALDSQHSMQSIVDVHHMLTYVYESCSCRAAELAQQAQAMLYMAQLDCLEDRLRTSYTDHNKAHNYFANVLTSAVSLGGSGGWRGELGARLTGVAARGVAFLTALPAAAPRRATAALRDRLLHTLPRAVAGPSHRPKWWGGSGAELTGPLAELVCWSLSDEVGGAGALRALYRAPAPALRLLPADPHHMRKLAVYILVIVQRVHALGEEGPPPVEYAITDWARGWALALQAALPDRLSGAELAMEAAAARAADAERWARAAAALRPHRAKVIFSKESLCARVSESAMVITRAAVEAQNAERKRFMEHLRRAHAAAAAAAIAWERLIEAHTHEQGVWHDPRSYPASWRLDATEGPGRVRVRLRRAHLNIPPRFLKPQCRYKAETIHRSPPLRSVVGGAGGARGGLVTRLQLNETVAYMARVHCVTVACETAGELLLSDRCIHFVPDDCRDEKPAPATGAGRRRERAAPPPERAPAQSWPLDTVQQVVTRRWCLQEVAVELFLSSNHAHLLAFADVAERAAFLKALAACHLPAKIEPDSLSEAMAQWRSGAITNWEYLMRLNGLGGRSYNDLMQYPVLPFVLADYSSRILDLSRPEVFRDLSRPMAVQNHTREQHYINVYNDLKAARREGCSPLLSRQPHHYASLYSNSGGVLHYLVRLPPFTELFLNYQDNNFDMPDRTFHSLATTWRLITNDSPTDVKELIPELFYLAELFHNNEGLELGTRQCGAAIDSVELPPWAADARLFTLIHRQALESRAVTDMLPHWVDLVFGYKQTGQAALDAINVFPACTYYGFDPGALEDAVDRQAAAAMVRTYGQAPRRLLRTPHPARPLHLTDLPTERQVWGGVAGAQWGRYCGSPTLGVPAVGARRTLPAAAAVRALPASRSAAAVPLHTQLVPVFGEGGGASGAPQLALLSWAHSDGIVRLKRRRDVPPDLLLHTPALDQITVVSSSCAPGGCPYPLVVGYVSGRVVAARVSCSGALSPRVRTRVLLAHAAPVTALHVCARAALLLTASQDGRIVLWDLNKLSYIRTLPNRDMLSVSHATVSETLCDVASVHDTSVPRAPAPPTPPAPPADPDAAAADEYEKDAAYKYKSLIRVHTCNATFVGSVKVVEEVTCICYSAAPEGVSVNCIAAGLRPGGVRLYSSWDLRPLMYIAPAVDHAALLSLSYSSDSSLLFGCYEGGTAVAWEGGAGARPAPVRIHAAHALF